MYKKRSTALLGLLFLCTSLVLSQDEVVWNFSLKDMGNGEIELVADAKIKQGWHLYDTTIPDGGPTPTQISFERIAGAEPIGKFHAESKAEVKYDGIFQMMIGTFQGNVRFVQRLKVTDKANFILQGDVRAQACDDSSCTPPLPHDFPLRRQSFPQQ